MEEVSSKPRSRDIEYSTHDRTHDHLINEDESEEVFTPCIVSLEYMLGEEVVQTLSESHIREYPHE